MDFNAYQVMARTTAKYPEELGLAYTALGLCSEAGEVADKLKKMIRDGADEDEFRAAVAKELGDVLWYVANVAWEIDYNLNDIAEINYNKLKDRYERNVISGSGDNR